MKRRVTHIPQVNIPAQPYTNGSSVKQCHIIGTPILMSGNTLHLKNAIIIDKSIITERAMREIFKVARENKREIIRLKHYIRK